MSPPNKKAKTETKEEIWKQKVWKKDDGTEEDVIEVEEEPRHHITFVNDFSKIIAIHMPPNDTTLAHRHEKDTIIIILMEEGIDFINDVMGCLPQKGRMEFGQVGFAPFTREPCVHKITNLSPTQMFVINIEVRQNPPVSQKDPLEAPFHSLVSTQYNCRIYKLSLKPGASTVVSYRFFFVRVILQGGVIENALKDVSWKENLQMGDCQWKEPCVDMKITNTGDSIYEAFVCEYL